ncbi:MAG TPA: hypothetical protein V6D50_11805 [Chroococcales cyanobacterium]
MDVLIVDKPTQPSQLYTVFSDISVKPKTLQAKSTLSQDQIVVSGLGKHAQWQPNNSNTNAGVPARG